LQERSHRQESAAAMAEYYAAQLMKDHATSRDLVLKLKHDKHSSSLTTDLETAGGALECVILELKAMTMRQHTSTPTHGHLQITHPGPDFATLGVW
jgi:hypothetical protein